VAPAELSEKLGRRVVPFWILQLAELLAAVALADLSLHVDRGGLLVAGTAVFALLAITANGPLGLVRVVPRRLHVYAVCVVAVVFALAPILPQIRPDVSGIIIIEFAAVGIFRLATMTSTVVTVRAPRGSRAAAQGASPTVAPPRPVTEAAPQPAPEAVSTSETAGRWISRQAGAAVQHAGIAAEAAALTAEKHAPAARAQAGRAVRSAGRLTGRLTRSVGTAPSSSGPASGPPSGSSGPAPGSTPAAGEPSETTDVQGPEDPK
jgi:hypothetical protein